MKKTAVVWTAVIAMAAGACSEVSFEGGGPVSITLISDRTTATTGQNIAFDVEARGSILDGVIVDFGDGVADTMYAWPVPACLRVRRDVRGGGHGLRCRPGPGLGHGGRPDHGRLTGATA